jgi:predicted KAP-like P-loop ATPase
MRQQLSNSLGSNVPQHQFSSEQPIMKLVEDELGRKDFAIAVANVIAKWAGRESLVSAIYGPWGSGKSSIKNMVLDALAEMKANTLTLEFDPWEWAGQKRVFEGFFVELSAKLGSVDASKKAAKTAKIMRMYGKMLSAAGSITGRFRWLLVGLLAAVGFFGLAPLLKSPPLLTWVSIFGAGALLAAIILTALGETTNQIADYLSAKAEANRKSVADVKTELRNLLGSMNKNVLVVVDDIDRLTPEGIGVVFQLVKANADFPNLIYLLLFQRDTIEKSLARMGEVDGPQFLEKIVQVGFDIPKLSGQKLEEILESAISKLVQGTAADRKFDSQRWGKLFVSSIRPYFRTVRDVKRFTNTLSFHFELYKDGDTFDANPIDLIALEVLRQFEAPIYQRLYNAKELLTGTHRSLLGPWRFSEQQEAAKALIENANHRDEAKDILSDVFPPFARGLLESADKSALSTPHAPVFRDEWLRDLRPCHPDMFERYFRFSLAAEDLSESDLSSLVASTGNRDSFAGKLRDLNRKKLLRAAVLTLGVNSQLIPSENTLPFVIGLLDLEKELFAQRSSRGVASVPLDIQAVLIIRSILKKQAADARTLILREAIVETTALYLPTISFESDEERKQAVDPLFSDDEARLLRELCVEKIRAAKLKPELLGHPWFRYILSFWSQWTSQEEVSAWFTETSKSESGLLSLLQPFVETMNQMDGERIVVSQYRFALEEFAKYVKPEDLAERVRQLAPSDDWHKAVCRLFIRAYDRAKLSEVSTYRENLGEWTALDLL